MNEVFQKPPSRSRMGTSSAHALREAPLCGAFSREGSQSDPFSAWLAEGELSAKAAVGGPTDVAVAESGLEAPEIPG